MNSRQQGALGVALGDRHVGTIKRDGSFGIRFTYDDAVLAAAEHGDRSGTLSVAMPPNRRSYGTTRSSAFFDGLLPEDVVRDRIAADRRIDRLDTFGLLASLAGDTAGAVVVTPHAPTPASTGFAGDVPNSSPIPLQADELEQLVADLPRHPLGIAAADQRFSLAGVQGKLMLVEVPGGWALPTDRHPSTHILKPTVTDPAVVLNEATCMRALLQAGLPTPASRIVTIGSNPAFLIERYDRIATARAVTRIHQEDLCQAISTPPTSKYFDPERSPEMHYGRVAEALDAFAESPGLQRIRLFDLAVASFALGNSDQHGKNISFLHDGRGGITLAPAYDVLSTQAWGPEYASRLAMPIAGLLEPDEVTRTTFTQLALECGLAPGGVTGRIDRLLASLASGLDHALEATRAAGFDDPILDALRTVFERRAAQLLA